jgi:hypothetical protein
MGELFPTDMRTTATGIINARDFRILDFMSGVHLCDKQSNHGYFGIANNEEHRRSEFDRNGKHVRDGRKKTTVRVTDLR